MVAADGSGLPAPLAAAALRLRERLTACARTAPALAVALSGGVDSRFLCLALQREGIPFLALHAGGPHVPEAESRAAVRWAEARGLALEVVAFSPLALPEVRDGSRERCYACKKALLAALRERLVSRGLPDALLCDGSNADDLHAHRPGLRALREAGVASPLAEAAIAKADLRRLGAFWGLEDPEQTARPCLLTRFAYGCRPEETTLRRLAEAEAALAALTDADGRPALGDLRLRLCPEPVLQHELPLPPVREQVRHILRASGFWPCDLQQTARVSGFFDCRALRQPGRRQGPAAGHPLKSPSCDKKLDLQRNARIFLQNFIFQEGLDATARAARGRPVEDVVKKRYLLLLCCLFWACQVSIARAEGFGLTEWSSRGLSLAGGMVGRADDPSALAYNAAGITQLPGTRVMGGFAVIAPMGTISAELADGSSKATTTKPNVWPAPHAYITHQLNDRFWLGLGMFSRFGLGNEFSDNWVGRYNLTSVNFQTFSLVPTVAMKVSDVLSLSAGVEVMYANFAMSQQIPSLQFSGIFPQKGPDSKLTLNGSGWGAGLHLGAHLRMTDELSLGFSYKSPVTLNISGEVDYSRHQSNMLADMGQVPHTVDTGAHSTVHLPDSFAVGLAYKPLDNLSFEVGTVFTRWSTYDSLNIYFDSNYQSLNQKGWRDGWNFNASVEYEPLDWLALRAGIWHETPVTNESHADFMIPSYGRTGVGLGAGFTWENWTLDLAYAHLWVYDMDYGTTDAGGIRSSVSGITGGNSRDTVANLYSVTVGYTF